MVDQNRNSNRSTLSNEELIQKARDAANGRKFSLRFDSKFEDSPLQREYDNRRQAEVALLANLAFWTQKDPEQMWQLFKRSELYRPEIESDSAYREKILSQATELVDDVYDPSAYT